MEMAFRAATRRLVGTDLWLLTESENAYENRQDLHFIHLQRHARREGLPCQGSLSVLDVWANHAADRRLFALVAPGGIGKSTQSSSFYILGLS